MHCNCGTNNRAPRWTFTDPCRPEVRPGDREESASPARLAAPAMNARDTSNVSQVITHPVFYGDLIYKLRRVKGEANFISSGSKIVKRLRRRQYDPTVIERTIGLVLGPFTAMYRSFRKRCTLTNKAVGTI